MNLNNKICLALFNDFLGRDKTFVLRRLFSAPKNLPEYNGQQSSKGYVSNREAADYLGLIFLDDRAFLKKIGKDSKGAEKRQIYHPAGSNPLELPYIFVRDYEWFGDEFFLESRSEVDRVSKSPKKRFGGVSEFFSPGSTVLDLGSGQGIALMQFSQACINRGINWIGVDKGYGSESLSLENASCQRFLCDDLQTLENIPDNSINRIMDVQSAFLYNSPQKIGDAINRVSRKGAILRSIPTLPLVLDDTLAQAALSLTSRGWDVYTQGGIALVAKKS